jgi:hypothetical protein
MDFKERYEFCKKIESYAQMVAACLVEQMKEAGVELYRELLDLMKDKSVVLEEYATRMRAP